jgi:protein SCO1/2
MRTVALALLVPALLSGCTDHQQVQKQEQVATKSNEVSNLGWQVPAFQFTDQNGKPFGLSDLKGKVWLADFIFTQCPDVCPPMTANMARVQRELKAKGVDLTFVSFSVDPDYDKPEVLKKFAAKYGADLGNWHFLTGYKVDEIRNIAKTVFKGEIIQQKGPSPEVPIMVMHPTQFYLVGPDGKVARFYDGLKPDPEQIAKDVQALKK